MSVFLALLEDCNGDYFNELKKSNYKIQRIKHQSIMLNLQRHLIVGGPAQYFKYSISMLKQNLSLFISQFSFIVCEKCE